MNPLHQLGPRGNRLSPRRAVPGPLLLAVASTVISAAALGAYFSLNSQPGQAAAVARAALLRKATSTPERVAETYLAALTGCDLTLATDLSRGQARPALRRGPAAQRPDWTCVRGLPEQGLSRPREAWRLSIRESHRLSEEEIVLKGTAEGRDTGRPCDCTVELVTVRQGSRWYVGELLAAKEGYRVREDLSGSTHTH